MKTKGSEHALRASALLKMAEQVERWDEGESGLDEAELKARIAALDSETALPEPLAAALGALSGGLRAGYAAMHPGQGGESGDAGGSETA